MAEDGSASLGSLIRQFRLAAAMSQEDLAEQSSVSVRTISDLERGIRETARLETVRLLAGALGLDGEVRTAMIGAAIRGTVAASPAPAPLSQAAPLPHPPNALIGRDALVSLVVDLVADDKTRVVTLTGVGGVGKTRLAIEVAARWSERYSAPVAFFPLALVTKGTRVSAAIAQTLDLQTTGESPDESVLEFLSRQERMLVVLDNFEHLLDGSSFVARMAERSPGTTFLVTSRSRLRLSLEREVVVPPLDLPEAGVSLETLSASGAVRLFAERARAIDEDLTFEGSVIESAAGICRRVDGLPLAIELAVTKLRVMSPETLLSLLEERLPVLTGGDRDQPERQQSMRQTIAWSYLLLGEEEQRLFRWLSVYVGGFSSESVAGTGSALGFSVVETFEFLEGLLESGLVQRQPGHSLQPRFRMLETVREYGREELSQRGELHEALTSHAQVILASCSEGANLPAAGASLDWLARMRLEDANFDAAFDFVCETGSQEMVAAFVSLAAPYWQNQGPFRSGALRLRNAVQSFSPALSIDNVHALQWTAVLSMYAGDYDIAKEIGESVRAMAIALGDRRAQAAVLHLLAWYEEVNGNWSEAAALFQEDLNLWQELGEIGTQGQIHMLLGGHAYVRGDYAEARRREETAAEIFVASEASPDWLASTEWYLGFIDVAEHKLHEAALRFAHSLEYWVMVPSRNQHFKPIVHLADVAVAVDDFQTAATLLGCCDGILASLGSMLFPFDRPAWERATEASRRALGPERFDELHDAASTLGPEDWLRLAAAVVDRTAVGRSSADRRAEHVPSGR